MAERYLKSEPYAWPYNGDLRPENTALIIIDMQTDFCGVGGYVDKMGYDLSLTRAPIEPIKKLLAAMRSRAFISSIPARAIARILRIYPPTSAGARARSAPASAIPALAAGCWCVAKPAGKSYPTSRRCRASQSSTSQVRDRSAPLIWS